MALDETNPADPASAPPAGAHLHPEPVVYVTVAPGFDTSGALAVVREAEGLTVIVDQVSADDDGLAYEFVGAWISLHQTTSLDAIGLTATIATALAADGIACNVVAGFFHDHLVVPWDRRHDALGVLDGLG